MKYIKFRFKDRFTHGGWSYNECEMESVRECIEFFGLKTDCDEYEILEVTDLNKQTERA